MLIDLCYSCNTCISLHILHTVLYAYPYVLIRRLYLTINRSLNIRFGGGGGLLDVGHLRVWMVIAMVSDKNIFGVDQFIQSDLLKCLSWFPYFPNLDEKSSWMIKYFCTVIVSMENRIDIFRDSYRLKINLVMSPE